MISMDMKERKLTVVGTVDPIVVVSKLRKAWRAELLSVGPAKEPEKKEEAKKQEPKKEEIKKEEPKKEVSKQKEESKKEVINSQDQMIMDLVKAYKSYNPQMTTNYSVHSAEEDPNSCVIC